jgi:hypothetical protein
MLLCLCRSADSLLKLVDRLTILLWLWEEEPPVNELLRSDRDDDADDALSLEIFVAAGILDPVAKK